jgi:MATE family multidrug resistance protein
LLTELRPLFKLAGPVIFAEIGWMSMGVVDTLMVGPLGPAAIAATGLASGVFTAIAVFGQGLMLGVDALVARSHGARQLAECLRWLHHAIVLAFVAAPFVMATTWLAAGSMAGWGLHPEIDDLAARYLHIAALGALPLLLYASFRRYLQGLHLVAPVMFALVSANLVNAAFNWILIYGKLGMPALGVEGSAWATSTARVYMAAFLLGAIRRAHRRRGADHPRLPFVVDFARVKRLATLGFPAASQVTLEVGAFAAVTALAGSLEPVAAASHQIALNVASLAFMVPLGLSSATAVRVSHAVGARDAPRAIAAGWTALTGGGILMLAMGGAMYIWPYPMLRPFTEDARVIAVGVELLAIAAAFQMFDGTQAVVTGALRGLGDTRTPMIMNIVGHWLLGLPAGYVLCFTLQWGVVGLWIGLSVGLVTVSLALTLVWARRTRRLTLPGDAVPIALPELL